MTEPNKPPVPPFTLETATKKVKAAEDAWNTCDPAKASMAYTPGSVCVFLCERYLTHMPTAAPYRPVCQAVLKLQIPSGAIVTSSLRVGMPSKLS